MTADPHLHRYNTLAEVYTIPAKAIHAAQLISAWIRSHVNNAMVIGPDSESEQWVAAVAKEADVPFTVLEKVRHGDRAVEISIKSPERLKKRTPVLIDDIISSGQTMLQAIKQIRLLATTNPVCIGVHGIFADSVDLRVASEGARVVTTNSIAHPTNAIDIGPLLAAAILELTIRL